MALSAAYKETRKRWKENNRDRWRELNNKSQRKRHIEMKVEAIQKYGGKCECCGEEDLHFLTFDHINGVPSEHKFASGRRISGKHFLSILLDAKDPNIRVLCMNCNYSHGHYGFCPHQSHEVEDRRYP